MNPTDAQLKARTDAANGVVSAAAIGNTPTFKPASAPALPPPDVSYQGLLDSVTRQEQSLQSKADAQQSNLDANTSRQTSILERLGLKPQVQQQKEQELGVTGLSQNVRDYRDRLANLEGQAATMRERVTEANRATGRSGYDLNMIESGASRSNAIDRISAASMLNAAQNNLTDARAEAQRATDIEFAPLERELQIKEKQYTQNKDLLDRYDAKASAAYAQKLELQKSQIALQKQDATDKRNLVLKGIEYGVDQTTLTKMQGARNIDDAIAIAGTKLRDPQKILDLQKTKLEMALNRAQIANQYDQIRSRKADDATKAANGGLTPAEARAAAKANTEGDSAKKVAYQVAQDTKDLAQSMLAKMKAGKGNSIVGGSRFFNAGVSLPGSSAAELQVEFNTLRDTLALGNIDKLKGAMSDKDIEFLRNTAAALSLSQGEATFIAGLEKIVDKATVKQVANIEANFSPDEIQGLDDFYKVPIQDLTNFNPNDY
jgi:hypothetical protein